MIRVKGGGERKWKEQALRQHTQSSKLKEKQLAKKLNKGSMNF